MTSKALSSTRAAEHPLEEALNSFGHEITKKRLQLYSGLDGDQTLQLVLPDAEETERKAILKAQGAIFAERYR